MAREYWGTLSIYDHRQPYFRPSMLLFDKIVIPVPTRPWKEMDQAEMERLGADAEWLRQNEVAVVLHWDPTVFDAWYHDHLGVLAAVKPDKQTSTRYQLKWLVDNRKLDDIKIPSDVTAVPLFVNREQYVEENTPESLDAARAAQATIDLILPAFPAARPDTPLEDIVRLREQGFVEHQVRALRSWQAELMSDLVALGDEPARWKARLDKAQADLSKAIADYRQGMANLADSRLTSRLTTLFALATPLKFLERVVTQHRNEFMLESRSEQSWKALYKETFAFAGVICTAEAAST